MDGIENTIREKLLKQIDEELSADAVVNVEVFKALTKFYIDFMHLKNNEKVMRDAQKAAMQPPGNPLKK